ncbi:MAG: FmdE family protein [Thermodesulfobacteriota bacterium]|nr:FmdE family protein [Thermodesulfobacteriota bacterium]
MNRTWRGFQASIIILFAFAAAANAFDVRQALRNGLDDLKASTGDPGLCILTDATYVRVDGKTSEPYVDVIQEETGCTVGRANLLFFHRPMDYPFKIAIFHRQREECVAISYDGKEKQRKKYDLGFKAVSKPEFWIELSPPLGPDTFTVVSLSHAWAAGVPYDLLKSAEFHGHFCPAIAAGHLMAQYISSNYPLKDGESYTWIASPPWCKDDALQLLLHLTPGKKRLYAQAMTASQKEALTFENPAGTLLISAEDKTKTRAVVFSFDWEKVRQEDKLKMALGMIPYLEKPEQLVKVVKESPVTPQVVQKLTTAETNPYKWLGLIR